MVCPDKLTPAQRLEVIRTAPEQGLKKHGDPHVRPRRRAGALGSPPAAQPRIAGKSAQVNRQFTELVPLPFVRMEAPVWRVRRVCPELMY